MASREGDLTWVPDENKEEGYKMSQEDLSAPRVKFVELTNETCQNDQIFDIGDAPGQKIETKLSSVGCCHGDQHCLKSEDPKSGGDQEFFKVDDHGNSGDQEIISLVSSGSEEILELYKIPNAEEDTALSLTEKSSAVSTISTIVEKPEKTSSKIPRGVESSLTPGPKQPLGKQNRGFGMSLSNVNLPTCEGGRLKSTLSKTSNCSISVTRKAYSPRGTSVSARGLEAELKALKKKYFHSRAEYDKNEKYLVGVISQIWSLIEKISEISGKERLLDDDLKGIRNFAGFKMGTRDKNSGLRVDISLYQNIVSEVEKPWQELIKDVLEYRKGMIKYFESRRILDSKPDFYIETELINRKLESTKETVKAKVEAFLHQVESQLKDTAQIIKNLERQIEKSENVIKDQENQMMGFKKAAADSKSELEKVLSKHKDQADKHTTEILLKNKEIESLREENNRVQNLNKNMAKNASNKEREYRESMALLNKQYEDTCRREKHFETKYDEIKDKLGNLQMRENNLKRKLNQTCHGEGGDTVRTVQTHEIEELKGQLKEAEEKIEILQKELEEPNKLATPIEPLELLDLREEGERTTSGDEEVMTHYEVELGEEVTTLRRVITRLHKKIRGLVTDKKESELDMERKIQEMYVWEKELSMREDRLCQQYGVLKMRKQLLTLLQTRERRRAHPSALSYEAVCDLLEQRKKEVYKLKEKVRLLKEQEQRHQYVRVRMEQNNAYLSKELQISRSPREGHFSGNRFPMGKSQILKRKSPAKSERSSFRSPRWSPTNLGSPHPSARISSRKSPPPLRKSPPPSLRNSPPPMRKSPSLRKSPPPSLRKSPPPSLRKSPPPSSRKSPPPSARKSPPPLRKSPSSRKSPPPLRKSPSSRKSPPPSARKSPPPSARKSPPPLRKSPPPTLKKSPPPSARKSPPLSARKSPSRMTPPSSGRKTPPSSARMSPPAFIRKSPGWSKQK